MIGTQSPATRRTDFLPADIGISIDRAPHRRPIADRLTRCTPLMTVDNGDATKGSKGCAEGNGNGNGSHSGGRLPDVDSTGTTISVPMLNGAEFLYGLGVMEDAQPAEIAFEDGYMKILSTSRRGVEIVAKRGFHVTSTGPGIDVEANDDANADAGADVTHRPDVKRAILERAVLHLVEQCRDLRAANQAAGAELASTRQLSAGARREADSFKVALEAAEAEKTKALEGLLDARTVYEKERFRLEGELASQAEDARLASESQERETARARLTRKQAQKEKAQYYRGMQDATDSKIQVESELKAAKVRAARAGTAARARRALATRLGTKLKAERAKARATRRWCERQMSEAVAARERIADKLEAVRRDNAALAQQLGDAERLDRALRDIRELWTGCAENVLAVGKIADLIPDGPDRREVAACGRHMQQRIEDCRRRHGIRVGSDH